MPYRVIDNYGEEQGPLSPDRDAAAKTCDALNAQYAGGGKDADGNPIPRKRSFYVEKLNLVYGFGIAQPAAPAPAPQV